MNKRLQVLIISVLSFLILLVSSLYLSEPYVVSAATKTSVALSSKESYLVKGEATTLKVTGTSKKAIWSSTNKSVATVSSSGKVTAVRYGTTSIKAKVNNQTYTCKVVVIDPTEISFEPYDTTVIVGGNSVALNPTSDAYSAAAIKKMGLTYKVSGNSGVKVSSSGKVTATKAGAFKVEASIHGKKIKTVSMKAATFDGFTVNEIYLSSYSFENWNFVGFAGNLTPKYDDIKVTVSDSAMATVELNYVINLDSNEKRYNGIYLYGGIDGTCKVSVTISGVTKTLKVIVGDGLTRLDPLEAVKQNDFSGYTGNPLIALTAIRKFIDDNHLLSTSLTDREKIKIIQDYIIDTYSGREVDDEVTGSISGVFLTGSGVCASYADTICFLFECIGLEVYYVSGVADNGVVVAGHAWNRVKLEGEWYYIDAYWNAGLGNTKKYYLTKTLWSDHTAREEASYYDYWKGSYPLYSDCFW